MSILKLKSGNLEMELTFDEQGTPQVTTTNGDAILTETGDDKIDTKLHMALIALALNQTGDSGLHDEESGKITIVSHPTQWNSKTFGFTNTSIKH